MDKRSVLTLGILMVALPAHSQLNIPGGPKIDIKLPSLADLTRGEAPLSVTIKDLKPYGCTIFDGYEPKHYADLTKDHVDSKGNFSVKPGAWQTDIHSFCARGYTYGPTKGMGYILGPWKGSKSKLLNELLHKYNLHPEVEQRDMQLLIWSILSRTKPQDMRGGARTAMLQLLGDDGAKLLAEGALDHISEQASKTLFSKASAELRPFLEFDNKMRQLFYKANSTYDDFERLAVLPAPADTRSEIPGERWNLHPKGYLVRWQPHGYSRSTMQIVMPHKNEVARDVKGRITKIVQGPNLVLELTYNDEIPSFVCPTDKGLTGWAINHVKSTSPDPSEPNKPVVKEQDVHMWVYTGIPSRAKAPAKVDPVIQTIFLRATWPFPQSTWFDRWRDRAERAQETRERLEEYNSWRERFDRIERGERDGTIDDVFDQDHINDGIEAATTGDTSDRVGWIAETHGGLIEQLAYATGLLNTLPDSSSVDPGDGVMVPGAGGHQNLIGSSRGF